MSVGIGVSVSVSVSVSASENAENAWEMPNEHRTVYAQQSATERIQWIAGSTTPEPSRC